MIVQVERGEALPTRLPLSRLSFRWQITLLGTLVCILFVSVLFATFATLHYTKSAILGSEKKQVLQYTENLAREYEDKAEFSRQNRELPPLNNPSSASSREVLSLLNRVVLQNVEGVTGGFYSRSADVLIGYSVPASGEPATNPEIQNPLVDEESLVLEAARNAASTDQPAEQVLAHAPGIVLIEAVPIREGFSVVGSSWSIKRLTVLPGSNRFRAYLATAGLGTAALASVLLTLFVIRNLQNGVRKIEGGLQVLEQNLASKIDTANDPEEIQRIVQAINRLGATLQANIEHEKKIESELRHSERLASLGRLVAGIAHEVRNPLATIRLRLQMCRRETANTRVSESCTVALEEVERLNGMVSQLLNFARPVRLCLERTNLGHLVGERMECFRDRALKSRVRIVASLPVEEKALVVDKGHMAQVFDNIIQNALEAMAESGGTLSVTMAPLDRPEKNSGVSLEFCDTGKGMNSALINHIFDPFFTTKPSGTGLGLSICHELVTAHGGEIHVESEEGRGTSVRVLMPA